MFTQLVANIGQTIGALFEIIDFDNRKASLGICQVYNESAKRATGDIVCFVHEDVLFETHDWGQRLLAHFADPLVGLVGVAGGDGKPIVPSSWFSNVRTNQVNLIQHGRDGSVRTLYSSDRRSSEISRPVIALDGVLMCTRRDILRQFSFDEQTLPGFHGYDIDFSLQVGSRYKNIVMFDVLIQHFSEGSLSKSWMDSLIKLQRKWKSSMPRTVYKLTLHEEEFYHWKSFQIYLEALARLQYPRSMILKNLLLYSFNRYFNVRRFLSMSKFVALAFANKLPPSSFRFSTS
jgi:glycosyltransferase involved in cell wall biosynthesis